MKIKGIAFLASAGVALAASPAVAQDAYEGSFYIGPQIGFHSAELDENDPTLAGLDIDDSGVIFGGVIGGDLTIGNTPFVIGAEADANTGTGPVQSDYGAVGYIGYQLSPNAQINVRGGWREVKVDFYEVTGLQSGVNPAIDSLFFNADNQIDDYTVGVGARFGYGNFAVRAAVDTLAFDSVRGTVAVVLMLR